MQVNSRLSTLSQASLGSQEGASKTATNWKKEYEKIRRIVLDCGLSEELKWGVPCYTYKKNNIVLIHGFKEYCALLFHKGVLLIDTNDILIQQTKNVQSARQIRFSNLQEIVDLETTIKAYIFEALEVERAGLEMQRKLSTDDKLPTYLDDHAIDTYTCPALSRLASASTAPRPDQPC